MTRWLVASDSEEDPIASPMKAKGVGELGLCGVSPGRANAPPSGGQALSHGKHKTIREFQFK